MQKGRDIQERTKRQFGMPYPEGYRKAMRAMELADRHGFPVISLVDTPGAYPGVAAEQHGQGGAIAASQALMARLEVPIVACVIGEGGSGGAIAIALADRVLMQENAIYSVISPEGCAAILWRDAGEARKAAAAFKPDAAHCLELGVDRRDRPRARRRGTERLEGGGAAARRSRCASALDDLEGLSGDELVRRRRAKFREHGRLRVTTPFSWDIPHSPQAFPRTASREFSTVSTCVSTVIDTVCDWYSGAGAIRWRSAT